MSTSRINPERIQCVEAHYWCVDDPLVGHYAFNTMELAAYNALVRDVSPDHRDLTYHDIIKLIGHRTELIMLMFDGEVLIGTAQASLTHPGGVATVWIEKVVVAKDYRRRGLGRQLIEATQAAAACRFGEDRPLRFCLTSRVERGTEAFYKGLGFTPTPTIRYTK